MTAQQNPTNFHNFWTAFLCFIAYQPVTAQINLAQELVSQKAAIEFLPSKPFGLFVGGELKSVTGESSSWKEFMNWYE